MEIDAGLVIGIAGLIATVIFGVCGSKIVIKKNNKNKNTQKLTVHGNINAPVVNGDNALIKTGADIIVSEEEPEGQEKGDLWLKIIKNK